MTNCDPKLNSINYSKRTSTYLNETDDDARLQANTNVLSKKHS